MNEIARNENVWLLVHRVQSGGPILLTTGWAQEGSDDFLRLGLADLERQKRSGSNPLAQNDRGLQLEVELSLAEEIFVLQHRSVAK